MKFNSVLFLAPLAVISVIAKPTMIGQTPTLIERDGPSINSALAAVKAQVNALNTAILAAPPVPSTILNAAGSVLEAINVANTVAQASAPLNQMDALNLVSPTQVLVADTNTTLYNLVSIKDQLVAAGMGCTTLQQLQEQYTAAVQLSTAIVSRVPDALQSVAQQLSAGIATAIQYGIDGYTGQCSSTTSASSTPSSTPTDTPSSTPTDTPTDTPTATPSSTPTDTPSTCSTPTDTPTDTPTATPSSTPTDTPTDTPTATPTDTPTDTPSSTPSTPCSAATITSVSISTVSVTETVTPPTASCDQETVTKTLPCDQATQTVTDTKTITKTSNKTATKTITKVTTKTIEPWWCDWMKKDKHHW